MVSAEPPFPLQPRHIPADFGRRFARSQSRTLIATVIAFCGLLFYFTAPFFAFIAVIIFLADKDLPLGLRILGFTGCSFLSVVWLKNLLPRSLGNEPVGLILEKEDQQMVHDFILKLADQLDQQASASIKLSVNPHVRIYSKLSVWNLFRSPKWELVISLWLWYGLNLSEFTALCARALSSIGRTFTERWNFRLDYLLRLQLWGLDSIDRIAMSGDSSAFLFGIYQGIYSFFSWPLKIMLRMILSLNGRVNDVLLEDLTAVKIVGSDAVVHAIARADAFAASFDVLLKMMRRSVRDGLITADLYAHFSDALEQLRAFQQNYEIGTLPVLRSPTSGKYQEFFEHESRYLSKFWKDAPPPEVREEFIKRDFIAAEIERRPALDLLANLYQLRKDLTIAFFVHELNEQPDQIATYEPELVRKWLEFPEEFAFPAKFNGLYHEYRAIKLADREQPDSVEQKWLEPTDLTKSVRDLYLHVEPIASRWLQAHRKWRKIMIRCMFRPKGRELDDIEDEEEELRKSARWLTRTDRQIYSVYMQILSRLKQSGLTEEFKTTYDALIVMQKIALRAVESADRADAIAYKQEIRGELPWQLRRDAKRELINLVDDLEAFIDQMKTTSIPFLKDYLNELSLAQFLIASSRLPDDSLDPENIRDLQLQWTRIAKKSRWLNLLYFQRLWILQDRIYQVFLQETGQNFDQNDSNSV